MDSKITKISASLTADQSLDLMLTKVNDGFTGGRVTKNDLTSWIILNFENEQIDDCLDKIRKDHFDQVAYLESVLKDLKQARKSGAATPELSTLLAPITTEIKSISVQKKLRSKQSESKDSNSPA